MPVRKQWCRREYVTGLSTVVVTGLAGCSTSADSEAELNDFERPPCADGFQITDAVAKVGEGRVPSVRLILHNGGTAPVEYEIRVVFQQKTSLGKVARTGRDVLTGTLGPGEAVERTATDDAPDVRSTTEYGLDVSLACRSA